MKFYNFGFLCGVVLCLALSSTYAQVKSSEPIQAIRIARFSSEAFGDPKNGISELVRAYEIADNSLKAKVGDLLEIQRKLMMLAAELARMDKIPYLDPDPQYVEAKIKEGKSLSDQFSIKKNEYDQARDNCEKQTISPVRARIQKALDQFAIEKGYAAMFDTSTICSGSTCIVTDLELHPDVTVEFISYYNQKFEQRNINPLDK